MDNQSVSLFNTDPAFIDLQRRQQLAQALSEQANKPDQIFQGPIGQSAIPSYAPITHGLRSFLAAALQKKVTADAATTQQQQRQQAADAIKQLYSPGGQSLGGGNVSFPGQAISAQAPSMPGGGAPLPAATAQLPAASAPGASMQTAPQGPTGAELAQLMTNPNPYLQNVVPAMFQNQLSRENTQWERGLPMSQAQKDQIELQGKTTLGNEEAAADFKNKLPLSAADQADLKIKQGQLSVEQQKAAEERRYHQQLMGSGGDAVENFGQNILDHRATLQNVPAGMRPAVSTWIAHNAPRDWFSPLDERRYSMTSSAIASNFLKLPGYQLTANGKPYLDRIKAAKEVPGSVADQELLDAFTKLSTSGNAITDAQVRIITDGKSLADTVQVMANKLKNGGVLSDNQRQQLQTLSGKVYDRYAKDYQPIYDQVTAKLKAAGIPEAFWTIPDLNKLDAASNAAVAPGNGGGGGLAPADQQALDWANANPKDARAAQIKQRLGR